MKRIVSTDERTVRFDLCAPDPTFLNKLALAPLIINDSGFLATAGVDGSIVQHENGTGPWKVNSWVSGEQIVLSRFDDYWGTKAAAKQLVLTWQQESNARLLQVQSGQADGAASIVADDYAAAEADPALRLMKRPPVTINYYFFNNKFAPFDDARVRRAIALGLDRSRIVENFFAPGSSLAQTMVPCTVPYACSGDDWYAYDPVQARALLAQAGYPNGFETTITVRDRISGHTPQPNEMAVDLQAQLKEIGINAKIETLENTTWQSQAISGEINGIMIGGGWVPDYLDPSNYLDFIFVSGRSVRLGNPYDEIRAAVAAADAAASPSERTRLYGIVENLIKRDVPFIPTAYGSSAAVVRADVQGAYASPVQLERLAAMKPANREKLVWLLEGEPNSLNCPDDPSSQDTFTTCSQFGEGLYAADPKSALPTPLLAERCDVSSDQLSWTCVLRTGVKFHNGASLDATDVVDSFSVAWDCSHPWRVGSTGTFQPWSVISSYLHPEMCGSK